MMASATLLPLTSEATSPALRGDILRPITLALAELKFRVLFAILLLILSAVLSELTGRRKFS